MALRPKSYDDTDEANILSQNNLTLCRASYFETCWCKLNATEPTTCPYLLRHVISRSNSTYVCVYHTIRKGIDCFNSSSIFTKTDSVSNIYIYFTIFLFIIGVIGNGLSMIVLCDKKLRRLSIYRNLTILCALNIFYLFAILIRHTNIYNQDLRKVSPQACRLHTFIVAFTGHLCSWQLVSTSIQRVYALLSLESHRSTSWIRTLATFFICFVLPLFIFDAQLLFNYGLLCKRHMCDDKSSNESRQFQRAYNFPINISKFSKNISIRYYAYFFANQSAQPIKCGVCILWNALDTFVYAIIPFIIILTSSIIIIVKICERRRSTTNAGGICHTNRRIISNQDNLSILLITINCLFLIMTGPFNTSLIIQSILKYFFSKSLLMKRFLQVNDYLRLLQNSYHALSFIFYCVIGNKFRQSAWSICRKFYCKLFKCISGRQPRQPLIITRCLDRKLSPSIEPTVSTSTNDNNRRMYNLLQINLIKKRPDITIISNEKKVKRMDTCV